MKFWDDQIQADDKILVKTKLYKKILLAEWFFVIVLTGWLLIVFSTILH
jgi:hypothetical protein